MTTKENPSSDLFDEVGEISPELRKELMDLATGLRSAAAKIDVLTQRKRTVDLDANGEPTFKFGAKVPIPTDFFLTQKLVKYAVDRQFLGKEIMQMADEFVGWYGKSGKKWQDWSRVWQDWVRREHARRIENGPKTGPRITSDKLTRY